MADLMNVFCYSNLNELTKLDVQSRTIKQKTSSIHYKISFIPKCGIIFINDYFEAVLSLGNGKYVHVQNYTCNSSGDSLVL